jgi:hypothetical protein
MEHDLNPAVAAAVELLVAHGWRWEGRGLQPCWTAPPRPRTTELKMQILHKLLEEEAHLL